MPRSSFAFRDARGLRASIGRRAQPQEPPVRERHYHHNRHPWAHPGDEPDRVFILRFSDPDMREQLFMGEGAEDRAHAAYRLYAPAWSVYLLATVAAAEVRDA